MSLHKYDHLLSFDLSKDFHIIKDVDDEGNPTFGIGIGKTVGDDGETNYEYRINLLSQDCDGEVELNIDPSANRLVGNIENRIQFVKNVQSFLGLEIIITTAIIFLIHKEKTYVLNTVLVGDGERLENWIKFINDILAAIVLDGQKGEFTPVTEDMIDEASNDEESTEDIENTDDIFGLMPYPIATPAENQHSHWDFLENTKGGLGFFGGLIQVNQSGAEYSFEELDEYYWERFDDEESLIAITESDNGFALAETAREMGEIFRVSEASFEGGEDRESEIENGLLRRCGMYEAFRSFAWTLAAHCDKNGLSPERVTIDDIEEIADFVVEQRGRLNYEADSFCPTLCSGDDIHNYYIPDVTSDIARNTLAESMAEESEDEDMNPHEHILSLDGLRKDMEYLFPVMQTIYDNLAADRDFDEALEGAVAEVLYVWCSMTYALRSPIYTEDGPMNCFWDHPGKMPALKSFGKAANRSEKQVDCGYTFTYEQGLAFENEHYSIKFPDGFVIKEREEDRDFIAYLPNENDPDDHFESAFVIYAGQDMNGGVNAQLKLPLTYHAVLNAFATQMPGTIPWYYHRRELPGIIAAAPEAGCLHANAVVAYGETLKMIRFQINVSSKKQANACESLIKSMLDKMVAKNPVDVLDQIDDAQYVNMALDANEVAQWAELMDAYSNQIAIARNQRQEQLVQSIQSNNPGMPKVKKMLRDMLRQYTDAAAECLKKADAIYQLKRAQFPNNRTLKKMKKSIDGAFLDLVEQFVNLDGERIESVDAYKETYEGHNAMTAEQAIKDVLTNCSDVLSDSLISKLNQI